MTPIERTKTWDDVRRIADQLELEIHLASMEARDHWKALKPKIDDLEKHIAEAGKKASEALDRELTNIGAAIKRLRDDIAPTLKH